MWIRAEFEVYGELRSGATLGLLRRLRSAARSRGVELLAFSVGLRVRVLFEGELRAVEQAVRGAKSGTVQSQRVRQPGFSLGATDTFRVHDLLANVADLHVGGLADPWCSHRDLLGFRKAEFYDARTLQRHVTPAVVHARIGGGPLPERLDLPESVEPELPLQIAASVLGVLPSDRRCFGLYAHLARACGLRQTDVAKAVLLTPRRIRQLQHRPEPYAEIAELALGDERLRRVA